MCRGSGTKVRNSTGERSNFGVKVGLYQGSPLSPYLLLILLDVLTKEVIKDAPETIMFAWDILLSDGKDVIGFLFQTKVNLLVYSIQF